MASFVTLKVRLGPLVSLELTGDSVREISAALDGFEHLNRQLEALCSDLADRVYPEGSDAEEGASDEEAAA